MPKDLVPVLRLKGGASVIWAGQLGATAVTQEGEESSLESRVWGNERGILSRTW